MIQRTIKNDNQLFIKTPRGSEAYFKLNAPYNMVQAAQLEAAFVALEAHYDYVFNVKKIGGNNRVFLKLEGELIHMMIDGEKHIFTNYKDIFYA